MVKKWIAGLLACSLVASALCGCGAESGVSGSESSAATSSSSDEQKTAGTGLHKTTPEGAYDLEVPAELEKYYQKYDPPIQMTQNVSGPEDETNFYPGDTWENNQFTEWAENVAGIQWSPMWEAPDAETAKQKLNLGMASGELPDIIKADALTIKQLAEAGAIIPLDDLMEEYMSPLLKEVYRQYEEENNNSVFHPVTIEGKKMAFVPMCDQVGPANIWYREDEVKALGMELPKTIEELEALFAAYKEKNPENKCLMVNKDLGHLNSIFGAYGAYRAIWLNQEEGIGYSSIQPEMKDALAKLAEWYQTGYIDPEFIIKDDAKAAEEFVAGNILCYDDGWGTVWGVAPNTLKNIPEAVLNTGSLIKGPEGMSGGVKPQAYYNYFGVSAQCKNPEAAFIQLNWLVDSALRNEASYREKCAFVYPEEARKAPVNNDMLISEGKDIIFQESSYKHPGPGTASTWFYNRGSNRIVYGFDFGQMPNELSSEMKLVADLVSAGGTSDDPAEQALLDIYKTYFMGFDMLKVNGGNNAAYLAEQSKTNPGVKIDVFSGLPTATMSEKKAYLDKLELETFTKIITGEYGIDKFDSFVQEWNDNGGKAITEEVNAWYQSVK